MSLFKFDNFFKKKKEEEKPKSILPEDKIFNIENFNDWFCNEYEGYDGRKGAKGIFKRLDKLGSSTIEDWFKFLNVEYTYDDVMKMTELIRKNWRKLLAEE